LMPGEEAEIVGRIRIRQPETKMGFYVGWYVESQDSYLRKDYSVVYRFFTPDTKPLDPSGIVISTTSVGVLVSWQKVEKNVDGTDLLDFACYRIYRTLDLTGPVVLFGCTTDTFYIDKEGLETEYFYIIKTVNQWNEESYGNNVVRLHNNSVAKIFTSEDKSVVVIAAGDEIKTDVITITRKPLLETLEYPLVCEIIVGEKKKLDIFVDVSIKIPDINKKYKVQYYDGHNWQTIPTKFISNNLNFKTQYLGMYRLILDDSEIEKLTILGCSPYKRIITPNNDGYNDEINFVYIVGTYLVGEIYDLNGKKVADMKQKDSNILYFDGKNNNGDYVLPGVYVYHITAKTGSTNLKEKSFTGTIVVKY
ncbi:MAG: gliding motility-associated C-terminal domain-containing protein, partial [Endomicrobiia bacterium]